MNRLNSRREGFALAAAVLAMLVVGAIVTGGFYAASQQGSISKSTDAGNMAFYIAETGLNAASAGANAATLDAMALNATVNSASATNVSYGGSTVGQYTWTMRKVSSTLFLLSATGTVTVSGPYSGAQRTLTQLVRLRKADFDNNTALQVYGNLTVGGSSAVNGNDYANVAWTSCPASSSASAVTANPTSVVSTSGSGQINPSGSVNYTAMDSSDFNVFGEFGFDEIASMANFTFASGVTVGPGAISLGGVCTTTNNQNWGAPTLPLDPCYNWYPIIYATGDLRISSGGTGQGILLVEGDLDVSGGFTFYGVAVVRGTIRMTGTGGHINGTLITYGDGNLSSTSTTLGNSVVQYSSCGISRAVLGNPLLSRVTPVANRSWMDMSNVLNSY